MKNIKHVGNLDEIKFLRCYTDNRFYKPLFVKIKPSGKCNLKCIKCNYWKKYHNCSHKGISYKKLKSLIDELAGIGCECIKFSGGEITLIKELPLLLKYAKEKGIKTSVTSNGILIDKKYANELVAAGLDKITISLDSTYPEVHDKIVGVNGAWKKTVKALKSLQSAKSRLNSNIKITVASVLSKLTYRELDKLLDLLNNLNIKRFDLLALVTNHLEDKELFMSKDEITYFNNKILPNILEKSRKYGIYLVNSNPLRKSEKVDFEEDRQIAEIYKEIPCFVLWYSFVILFDGRLVPCCSNKDFVLGNINENSIKEIINNEKARKFMEIMKCSNKPRNCFLCLDEIERNKRIKEGLKLGDFK